MVRKKKKLPLSTSLSPPDAIGLGSSSTLQPAAEVPEVVAVVPPTPAKKKPEKEAKDVGKAMDKIIKKAVQVRPFRKSFKLDVHFRLLDLFCFRAGVARN